MNQPEDILKSLSLKPASARYQTKADELFGQPAIGSINLKPFWQWSMAAALLLSLTLNVVQFQLLEATPDQAESAVGQHEDAQKNPGGYSIVQSDESPDGLHQSITIIWENKS
ncbi:hypothetical protein [Marinicella meishanensis]|uniref:hypothetical protein n=1 Tax=Marinicella meishanensis TaxID=2873263 RepID=UPI001CC0D836|nr:hypothetical protein [Marinicella sp. NBU2979]